MIRAMTPALAKVARFVSNHPLRLAAGGILLFSLSACSPVGTAVGVAATTINLATQERGLVTGVDDNLIWVGINDHLFKKDAVLFKNVSLQVHEGRVLLTGFVPKPEDRLAATEIAWQSKGVREVMNEMKVGRTLDFGDYSEDAFLINRLKLKLMADRQIRANNFSIDCIRSTIYLMGVAKTEAERQRVIDHARDIAYVRAVVSHVRVVSDPLPPIPAKPPVEQPGPVSEPVVASSANTLPSAPISSAPITSTQVSAQPISYTAGAMPGGDLPKSTQPASQKNVPPSQP
ncbi:BON domain-containing protein [Dongia sp.]|uniref:BON domain-containing protein n=1 Tax=Dongia sp. TaxID=1977262 RepID=UPI0035B000FE